MRTVHILNPAAGKGDISKYLENPEIKDNSYVTKGIHDAEMYAFTEALKNPYTRFVVYGGDGTANEVLNGIMKSGKNDTVQLKVIPTGTGNDFIKSFNSIEGKEQVKKIDIIKYNDKFALNILNFGFDCNVVISTQKYKKIPLISGSFAYVLGVADRFVKKMGEDFSFEYVDENDVLHTTSDTCTLCTVANGRYYGGGFMAAPTADLQDGLLDLMIVKKAKRLQFLAIIKDYKQGKHIDPASNKPTEAFQKLVTYTRCKSVKVSGLSNICADGEVESMDKADISVIRNAINVVY